MTVEADIEKFIKEKVEETKVSGVVLGVSGGLDSTVVLTLCVKALGNRQVVALIMPTVDSSAENTKDAVNLASDLGVEYHILDMTSIAGLCEMTYRIRRNMTLAQELPKVARGNLLARLRMLFLYFFANVENLLVVGASNKSEISIGYFTKHGDGAADILPLAGLYKTQVRTLAKRLGIPDKILDKPPSADLWPGQTDEDEMGFSYEVLDRILEAWECCPADLKIVAAKSGFDLEMVEEVVSMVKKNAHKRKLPDYLKV